MSLEIPDIEELINDREKFDSFVYTPLIKATIQIEERRRDDELNKKVLNLIGGDVPGPLQSEVKIILGRHLVTTNYEVIRFINIVDSARYKPLFFEYYGDKFVSNNGWKHSLGKLSFFQGSGSDGRLVTTNIKVIDFNSSNGKLISDIKTLWGESLVDFHHSLFKNMYPGYKNDIFFNATEWLSSHGKFGDKYYIHYLSLFLSHGILFENFLFNDEELAFTRQIFLPAFIYILKNTGVKPLIVALEPTSIEGDEFWLFQPPTNEKFVADKLI